MSMSINNNSSSMNNYYAMKIAKKKEEEESEKLSSGLQINRAGDDAAGLAISEKMRADITIAGQAQKNAKDAQNMTKTAEGAMAEVNSMLTRATELATQSSNGTYTDVERGAIQSEIDAIASEINRISASTNFNGISLLDGSASVDLQVGTDGSVDSTVTVDVGSVATAEHIDPSQMSVMTQEDAVAILEQLKEFVNTITSERAELGATENRLQHTSNALSFMEENLQRAESEIRDTDMAKTASEKSKASLQFQFAAGNMANSEEQQKGILNLLA